MFNLKHISVNLAGAVLPMVVILFSVPLYLHAIGTSKYGVLSLVWLVFGYFGVLDFGVSRAVTNLISRVRGDSVRRAEVVWTALALTAVFGAVMAGLAGLGYLMWSRVATAPVVEELLASVPVMMVGVPVVMMTGVLNGALDGEERFKTANVIQVGATVLYHLSPLLVAYLVSQDLNQLIAAVIAARVVVLAVYGAVAARAFGLFGQIAVNVRTVRELLRFGSSVAAINLIDPIFSRVDQLVIARFTGTDSVAAYNIATNSIGRLSILPLAMSRSIFPRLSKGTLDDVRAELVAAKGKVIGIWFAICALAILFSDLVFRLWLHNDIANEVSAISKVFIVGLWANCLTVLPYTALQAVGRSSAIIKAHMIEAVPYVALLFGLTYLYGPLGAAFAYGIRNFIDYIVLWKMCDFPVSRQAPFAVLFLLMGCLAFVGLSPFGQFFGR